MLLLRPTVVLVVVITSAGGVTKRVLTFAEPVDPGLVEWAREYLNESLAGVQLGTHTLRRRLRRPRAPRRASAPSSKPFAPRSRISWRSASSASTSAEPRASSSEARADELEACQRLLETLEQRATLLQLIGEAIEPRRAFVRVGDELDHPGLRDVALVGSTYGLANRTLGAVSLLGPVRMDYDKALRSVRGAAQELSRFVEGVYGES